MANQNAKIDDNRERTLLGVTDDVNAEIRRLLVDDATGRLKVSAVISGGTTPLTTKGDLLGYTTEEVRIPVGTDGQVLQADSTQAAGVKWATAGSGDVTAASNLGDNLLIRGDGAVKGVQNSGISIDDTDNMTGVASITVGNTGLIVGTSTPFSDSAGTLTLQNIDAIDATTESTIEAAIDSLVNLTTVGTIGTGTWQADAIGVAYGGTGQTSYTDGQLLIGNSTGNTLAKATLTAGAGIDITNGSGTITIDGETASDTNAGIVELATTAETTTGTDTGRAVTPSGLANGYQGTSNVVTLGTVTSGNVDAVVSAASVTTAGKIEVATSAETNTGTDATRAVSPDGLAGSNYGTKSVCIAVTESDTDCAVANGTIAFVVPASMGTMDLVGVTASVHTAGTTGTMDIQIRRRRATTDADMLSTKVTIDSTETSSTTAATPYVINTSNDDVNEGDNIYIDVDAVHTTAAKGLSVVLEFRVA